MFSRAVEKGIRVVSKMASLDFVKGVEELQNEKGKIGSQEVKEVFYTDDYEPFENLGTDVSARKK